MWIHTISLASFSGSPRSRTKNGKLGGAWERGYHLSMLYWRWGILVTMTRPIPVACIQWETHTRPSIGLIHVLLLWLSAVSTGHTCMLVTQWRNEAMQKCHEIATWMHPYLLHVSAVFYSPHSLHVLQDICQTDVDDKRWLSKLEATHWLDYIQVKNVPTPLLPPHTPTPSPHPYSLPTPLLPPHTLTVLLPPHTTAPSPHPYSPNPSSHPYILPPNTPTPSLHPYSLPTPLFSNLWDQDYFK